MSPIDIIKFVKYAGCYPNAWIAYRVLLTVYVWHKTHKMSEMRMRKDKTENAYGVAEVKLKI
jgi:hypothetical protein